MACFADERMQSPITAPTVAKPSTQFTSSLTTIGETDSEVRIRPAYIASTDPAVCAQDESSTSIECHPPSLVDDTMATIATADTTTTPDSITTPDTSDDAGGNSSSLYGFAETAGMTLAAALGIEEPFEPMIDIGLYGAGLEPRPIRRYVVGSWRDSFEETASMKDEAEAFSAVYDQCGCVVICVVYSLRLWR